MSTKKINVVRDPPGSFDRDGTTPMGEFVFADGSPPMRAILEGFARFKEPDSEISHVMWSNDQEDELFLPPECILVTECSIYAVDPSNSHRKTCFATTVRADRARGP